MEKNLTAIAFVLTLLTTGLFSSPLMAQMPGPGVNDYVDSNGVDLISLHFNWSTTELSIGQPDAGGLSYIRSIQGYGWTDNFSGTIYKSGSTYKIAFGRNAETFTEAGGFFIPAQGQGSALRYESGTDTYVFTSVNGVVSTFKITANFIGYSTGHVLSTVYPSGDQLTYHYVEAVAEACPPTQCTAWVNLRRLQAVTNNLGYQIRFNYAANGFMLDYEQTTDWQTRTGAVALNMAVDYCDPEGSSCPAFTVNWPAVTYAASNGIETVTDVMGRVTRYLFGPTSIGIRRPSSPNSNSITVTVESATNPVVTKVETPVSVWNYSRVDDGNDRTTTVTDWLGNTRIVTSNILSALVYSDRDGVGKTTSFTYDTVGRLSRVTSPGGGYSEFTYDARGNITQTRRVSRTPGTPSDIITSASYPATCASRASCNKPTYTIDARGAQTDYTYSSAHGEVLTVTEPAPATGGVRPKTTYTYEQYYASYKSSSGSIVQAATSVYRLRYINACATLAACVNSADEVRATFDYGPGGGATNRPLSSVTKSDGSGTLVATTTLVYDSVGNLAATDGPLSGTVDRTYYHYDATRWQVGMIGPDPDDGGPLPRLATRFTYDADGLITVTDRGPVAGTGASDLANMTVGERQATAYDVGGRKIRDSGITMPSLAVAAVTQYGYDSAGRLQCRAVRMNPGVFGNLPDPCIPGPVGNDGPDRIQRFTYDGAGRLLKQTDGYGTAPVDTMTMTYTDDGLRATMKDGEGRMSTFEYDGFNRLAKLRYPVPVGTDASSQTDFDRFEYDAASNLTHFWRRDGELITLAYDALNRLKTKTPPTAADVVEFVYDNLGRTRSASTASQTVSYTWDALGRVINQVSPQGTWVSLWDVAGRRTRLTWPDGFYVTYDYDNVSAVTAIRENGATSGPGVLATFSYDAMGRRASITRGNNVRTTYSYDGLSRLHQLSHQLTGTGWDTGYNQLSEFSYNAASQIISQTNFNSAYDWDGAPVEADFAINGLNQLTHLGTTALPHDGRGNLTGDTVRTYGFDVENRLISVNGSSGASLSYDPLGRLHETKIGSTSTAVFAYDGVETAAEYVGGSIQKRYVYGPGIDEVLVAYQGSGTSNRQWMVADARGSVIAVTDGTGNAITVNRYDDYGRPGSANLGRFQYTGQMWLPEAGVYHYKARAYQPALGRFLQTDPIGYSGGMNLYGYVGGDPINGVDPSGLRCVSWYGRVSHAQTGVDPDGVPYFGTGWDSFDSWFCFDDAPNPIGPGGGGPSGGDTRGDTGAGPQGNCSSAYVCRPPQDPCAAPPAAPYGLDKNGNPLPEAPMEGVYPELFIAGWERLAYAGLARLIPSIARSLPETSIGQAAFASAARNSLKEATRFPFNRLFPAEQPFSLIVAKYGGDADAIINAAARTNTGFNTAGAAAAAVGTNSLGLTCTRAGK